MRVQSPVVGKELVRLSWMIGWVVGGRDRRGGVRDTGKFRCVCVRAHVRKCPEGTILPKPLQIPDFTGLPPERTFPAHSWQRDEFPHLNRNPAARQQGLRAPVVPSPRFTWSLECAHLIGLRTI